MSTIDIDEDEYDNLSYSDEDVREVMEKDESSSDEESDEEDGIERAHLDHEYCEQISIMELESGMIMLYCCIYNSDSVNKFV